MSSLANKKTNARAQTLYEITINTLSSASICAYQAPREAGFSLETLREPAPPPPQIKAPLCETDRDRMRRGPRATVVVSKNSAGRRMLPRGAGVAEPPLFRLGRGELLLQCWDEVWGVEAPGRVTPRVSRSSKGLKSPRHMGHNAQRLSQGITHSPQKEWPQGSFKGPCPAAEKQIAHSSAASPVISVAAQRAVTTSISADEKPRAIFFSPVAPSSYEMRPSSTEERGTMGREWRRALDP